MKNNVYAAACRTCLINMEFKKNWKVLFGNDQLNIDPGKELQGGTWS